MMCSKGRAGTVTFFPSSPMARTRRAPSTANVTKSRAFSRCPQPRLPSADSRWASCVFHLGCLEGSNSERDRPSTLPGEAGWVPVLCYRPGRLTENTPCGSRCLQVTQVWRKSRVTVKSL